MKPFKPKLKEQNHTHSSLKYEERTKNRSNKTKPNKNPTTKTNGTAAVNRAVSLVRGLVPPWGEMPRLCAIPSNKRTLEVLGHLSESFPHLLFLFTPLPSFSFSPFNFSSQCFLALMSLGFCFIQKYLFERFFSPLCCVEPSFFSTSLLFPACVSTSPILTLLLTTPPKLAPSVNTGVYFLFPSLMKVLSQTRLNMRQDAALPLNRRFVVVCQDTILYLPIQLIIIMKLLRLYLCGATGHSTV